jgi:hypothetical protein
MGAPNEGGTTCRAINEINGRRLTTGPMLASRAHHGSETVEGEVHALPHVNLDAHPGMNATLEQVFSFRQIEDMEMAALKNPGLRHRDCGKTTCTFGDDVFARSVQSGDEPSSKLLHLSICQLINSHL